MSLYKVGETWYIYVTSNGKRVRRSTGTSDKKQAQRIHDEYKAQSHKKRPNSHTWQQAVNLWLEGGEKGLQDLYRLRQLKLGDTDLSDLDENALQTILARFRGSTRNRVINLLHAIFATAHRHGWIDKIPHMEKVKLPPQRIRWLTPKEWEKLRKELPEPMRTIASFALATGLRARNVLDLDWSQIDLKRRVMWIHPDQAKARQPIGIPLSAEAVKLLGKKGVGKVFDAPWQASNKHWYAAVKRAGLDGFRFHDLRHTWASWHIQNGTPLEVLQKLGGWNSLAMVMRYAHLSPDHLKQWANNAKKGMA